MANINEVAKIAGVSKATVSNVFSKKKKVSEEVAQRVLDICRDLKYHPNKAAASLTTKKTNIIGLYMTNRMDFFKSYYNDLIKGIIYTASELDYKVLLDISKQNNDENSYYKLLSMAEPIEGYILHSPQVDDERIGEMLERNIAFILIGSPSNKENKDILYIDVDNEDMTYQTTKHLLELGHKNIGFLNSMHNATITFNRLKGYIKALTEYKIEFNPAFVYNTDNTAATGKPLCNELLVKNPNITAIMTCSDDVAVGVYEVIRQRNLKIPQDISVIALGGDDYGSGLDPRLTTVLVNYTSMGAKAIELLIKKINGEDIFENYIIAESKMMKGNSTGPVKKNV